MERRYNCTIRLTHPEYELAIDTAKSRHEIAVANQFRHVNRAEYDLPNDRAGCKVECAWHVWQKQPWTNRLWKTKAEWMAGVAGRRKPPDFEPNIELRAARTGEHSSHPGWPKFHLLVQKEDYPERIYILGSTYDDSYYVDFLGWMYGYQAQKEKYWRALGKHNRPCYCVPDDGVERILNPMEDLPGIIAPPPVAWRFIYNWNNHQTSFSWRHA